MKRPRETMYGVEFIHNLHENNRWSIYAWAWKTKATTPFRLRKIAAWLLEWANYLEEQQ